MPSIVTSPRLRNISSKVEAMEGFVERLNVGLAGSQVEVLKKMANIYNSVTALYGHFSKVQMLLNTICKALDKEVVIFFDEADCLSGPGLVTFLTQIRAGYIHRHQPIMNFQDPWP